MGKIQILQKYDFHTYREKNKCEISKTYQIETSSKGRGNFVRWLDYDYVEVRDTYHITFVQQGGRLFWRNWLQVR